MSPLSLAQPGPGGRGREGALRLQGRNQWLLPVVVPVSSPPSLRFCPGLQIFMKLLGPECPSSVPGGGSVRLPGSAGRAFPSPRHRQRPPATALATAWGAWFGFLIDSSFLLVIDLSFFMMSLGFSGQTPEL